MLILFPIYSKLMSTITVIVRNMDGKYHSFRVKSSDRIGVLETKIEEKLQIPFSKGKVYLCDGRHVLYDPNTFNDYSIQDHHIINIHGRL